MARSKVIVNLHPEFPARDDAERAARRPPGVMPRCRLRRHGWPIYPTCARRETALNLARAGLIQKKRTEWLARRGGSTR